MEKIWRICGMWKWRAWYRKLCDKEAWKPRIEKDKKQKLFHEDAWRCMKMHLKAEGSDTECKDEHTPHGNAKMNEPLMEMQWWTMSSQRRKDKQSPLGDAAMNKALMKIQKWTNPSWRCVHVSEKMLCMNTECVRLGMHERSEGYRDGQTDTLKNTLRSKTSQHEEKME